MGGVVKLTKKVLENANIINTGGGAPAPTPTPTAPPIPQIPLLAPTTVPQLQAAVPVPVPDFASLQQARQKQITRADYSGAAGRAGTILSRRRRENAGGGGGGATAAQTYTNTALGK